MQVRHSLNVFLQFHFSVLFLQFPVQIARLMAMLHSHFSENKVGSGGFCIFSSLSDAAAVK